MTLMVQCNIFKNIFEVSEVTCMYHFENSFEKFSINICHW